MLTLTLRDLYSKEKIDHVLNSPYIPRKDEMYIHKEEKYKVSQVEYNFSKGEVNLYLFRMDRRM